MREVLITVGIMGIIVVALTVFSEDVSAKPPDNVHVGTICLSCHKNYSDNPAISKFFPCSKSTCHKSNPTGRWGWGPRNRYSLHLKRTVCINCHDGTPEKFDIHAIHLNFEKLGINRTAVECAICHWTPEGYNSSIAKVPAYEDLYVGDSAIKNMSVRPPPWGGDCGYCHEGVSNAKRLHDVHEPVLNTTCKNCHGPAIEKRPDLIVKIIGESAIQGQDTELKKKESLVLMELSKFFSEILEVIMSIFT